VSAAGDITPRAGAEAEAEAVSPAVAALLDHLARVGFDGSPRVRGATADGRRRVEAVPGRRAESALSLGWADLVRVGQLIRRLHDAAATFAPPPGARWDVGAGSGIGAGSEIGAGWQFGAGPDAEDLVCHHDLVPANLVLSGDRWVFVGWEGAGPGSRLWELAGAAAAFVPFTAVGDRSVDAPRLRALADGYGLDGEQRRRLPALIGARLHAAAERLRLERATDAPARPSGATGPSGSTGSAERAELADRWDAAADRVEASHDTWVVTLLA